MANFCLPKPAVDKFTQGLRDGTIDPYKLNKMTSEERHKIFEGIVGKEGAKQVNAEFESRMLLKNQKYAYTAWAKKVAGITPPVRRDLMSKISKLDHILNPEEEKAFLQDLASTKLGVNVTAEEAGKIAKLSKVVQDTEAKGLSTPEQALEKGFTPSATDLAHGYARYDLQKYVSDLKNGAESFKASDLKSVRGIGHTITGLPKKVADVSKSIGASLDDSFALRQGAKAFFTNNALWRKNFIESFANLAKGFKNSEVAQREFKAHLMADPMYDKAVRDGLGIIGHEDVFPTSLPGKIPVAGRAFNASEVAYDAFAENLRMGIYKQQLKLAQDLGEHIDNKEFGKNIAKEVNSLTGRGGLGRAEPLSGPINVAFYSLRFLKSNVDTLLLHPAGIGVGGVGSAAQKTAAKNLVKIIAGTAAILGTAKALKPNSVDFDPRSSDFGKIKVGDTRFEVTGGMDSIVTLASRLLTESSKSSTTGKVTKLNSGAYGAPTLADTVINFLENKTSPVGGVAVDVAKGKTHAGTKPTVGSEVGSLVEPLNVKNFTELKSDKNSANILAAMIADTLGVSTNTYGKSQTVWNPTQSAHLQAFNKAVGDQKFKQANTDYNNKLDAYMQKIVNNPTYKALPDSQKAGVLTAAKTKIQSQVFKDYGFKYKSPPRDKQAAAIRKSLLPQ